MLGGGPVFILECAISVIIEHGKSNAIEVASRV